MAKLKFDPKKDIPDLTGKVILVTGGASGVGLTSCLDFAQHNPAHIYIATRSASKASSAISAIAAASPSVPVTHLPLDLASFASIHACAAAFLAREATLNILLCNAGIMAVPFARSPEGYEVQFATNFLGHALLTALLLPTLAATAKLPGAAGDARIVNVSSQAAYLASPAGGVRFDTLKSSGENMCGWSPRWACYGQSKLAQILYTQELARRLGDAADRVKVVAVHPGVITQGSGLSEQLPTWEVPSIMNRIVGPFIRIPSEEGSWNSVWAATARWEDVKTGEMYEPVGEAPGWMGRGVINNKALAEKLWSWTEKELEGQKLK